MITAQSIGFVNTPPLWKNRQFDIQQFEFPIVPMDLFQPLAIPNNLRLGHQIEYVFKQLIEYSEDYDIVLYNQQIKKGKITIGEIDFILRDTVLHKLIHVELTYKFYLIDPTISEPIHSLIGPNRRDLFFTKMEKIKNRQFPLLHSEEGIKVLEDRNIDHLKVEHQCCFKGQLFQPYGSSVPDLGEFNEACLAGYWLRFDDFQQSEFADSQFYIPTKSEWVIEPHGHVAWKSRTDIIIDIEVWFLREKAPLLWMKKANSLIEKVFVVWW